MASSLFVADAIPSPMPSAADGGVLFCSSMLNLPEVLALRPDVAATRKVVYFHENQLEYPQREDKERDYVLKWSQIITALTADVVCFNSAWNKDSFLAKIDATMRKIPDKAQRVMGVAERIAPKCRVLYFPVELPAVPPVAASPPDAAVAGAGDTPPAKRRATEPLHIAWNHRWEHDKNPAALFDALRVLHDKGLDFRLVLLGEQFAEVPPEFEAARAWLEAAGKVAHWGYAESKAEYYRLLHGCDVVVSTAVHEFFGVSMVEAAACGCYPLAPARLAYPEVFPAAHLYKTDAQLRKRLRAMAYAPHTVRGWRHGDGLAGLGLERFTWAALEAPFREAVLG